MYSSIAQSPPHTKYPIFLGIERRLRRYSIPPCGNDGEISEVHHIGLLCVGISTIATPAALTLSMVEHYHLQKKKTLTFFVLCGLSNQSCLIAPKILRRSLKEVNTL